MEKHQLNPSVCFVSAQLFSLFSVCLHHDLNAHFNRFKTSVLFNVDFCLLQACDATGDNEPIAINDKNSFS